jgi:hypothetical protein
LNWEKLSVIGRDRDSFKTLVDRKIRGQSETSGDLPSSVRQNINSRRENHALPMREVIALLGDCPRPRPPQHNSTGKH